MGRRLAVVFVVALVTLAAWGTPVGAQRPQLPAFRTGVTLVPLDVRVLDSAGRPVTDLAAEDFTIHEEGVRQEVAHFSTVALAPASVPRDARPHLRRTAGLEAEPSNQRVFLIVLGRGRLQGPSKGFDALVELVRERLLPQDLVAVVAYNQATEMTTDHDGIALLIERFAAANDAIEAKLRHHFSGLQLLFGSKEIPDHIQAEIAEVFDAPGVPDGRSLPPTGIPDGEIINVDTSRMVDAIDLFGRDELAEIMERRNAIDDITNLYMGIEYLRFLEGEKHLVYVTEFGMVGLDRAEHARNLASIAADARVAISVIQTGGLAIGGFSAGIFYGVPPRVMWATADGRLAAERTGGLASFHRYADRAVERLDQATRFRYVLGYYPTDGDWDGSFRRVRVDVNRPGVTVHVRDGYFARHQLVPFDRQRFMTYSRVLAAASWGPPIEDIPVTVTTDVVFESRDAGEIDVEVSIDPSALTFEERDGQWTASFDVAVFAGDNRKDVAGEVWETVTLAMTPETYARVLKEGVTHTARVETKGPARQVKVVVYDYAADRLGTTAAKVK